MYNTLSLSCFSNIQAHFDPIEMGDTDKEPIKLDISNDR